MNEVNMMYLDKRTVPGSSACHCFQSNIGQRSHQITDRRTWFLSLAYGGSLIGSLHLPRPTVFLVQQAEQPRWFSLSHTHGNKVASSCRVFRHQVGLHLENLQGSSTAHLSAPRWSVWQYLFPPHSAPSFLKSDNLIFYYTLNWQLLHLIPNEVVPLKPKISACKYLLSLSLSKPIPGSAVWIPALLIWGAN